MRKEPNDLVQSVNREIDLLQVLSENPEGFGITELSERTKLPKSTISRLLATLQYRGFVKNEGVKYKLGLKLFELASFLFNDFELRPVIRPYLERLVRETNATGHLAILDQGEMVYIDKVEPLANPFLMYSKIGKRAPVHCTAIGKAVLACLPEEQMEAIIADKGLPSYTKQTITDLAGLKANLGEIRQKGYAIDNRELQEEIRCVAAPVFDYSGKVIATISISGPVIQITEERVPVIGKLVSETADAISLELGYNHNYQRRVK